MAKRKPDISMRTALLAAVVIIIAIGVGAYVYNEYKPASIVYEEVYETATISTSDARSGEVIDATITLKGTSVSYGPRKLVASSGAAEFPNVPRGDYEIKAELTGFYDFLTTNYTIESRTVKASESIAMDNIGTFSWAETAATAAPNLDENDQVVILRVYLNNSQKDTVLKDVKMKLVAVVDGHENMVIEKLECTSHSFATDDLTAEKWIIDGATIGDIEGEATVTVTYRVTLDVTAATADPLVFTASITDLDGDSPETSASKTITWTAA